MKQIYLNRNYIKANTEALQGKTIRDVSLTYDIRNEESLFVLTFTDDTYIYLWVSEDYISSDSDEKDYWINNGYATSLSCYSSPPGDAYGGKFHYYYYIQELIRLGILKGDEELELKKIKEQEEHEKELRYSQYLKLKKEFEPKENNK